MISVQKLQGKKSTGIMLQIAPLKKRNTKHQAIKVKGQAFGSF